MKTAVCKGERFVRSSPGDRHLCLKGVLGVLNSTWCMVDRFGSIGAKLGWEARQGLSRAGCLWVIATARVLT